MDRLLLKNYPSVPLTVSGIGVSKDVMNASAGILHLKLSLMSFMRGLILFFCFIQFPQPCN